MHCYSLYKHLTISIHIHRTAIKPYHIGSFMKWTSYETIAQGCLVLLFGCFVPNEYSYYFQCSLSIICTLYNQRLLSIKLKAQLCNESSIFNEDCDKRHKRLPQVNTLINFIRGVSWLQIVCNIFDDHYEDIEMILDWIGLGMMTSEYQMLTVRYEWHWKR